MQGKYNHLYKTIDKALKKGEITLKEGKSLAPFLKVQIDLEKLFLLFFDKNNPEEGIRKHYQETVDLLDRVLRDGYEFSRKEKQGIGLTKDAFREIESLHSTWQ
jgi:site-specific recombinase